MAAEKLKRFFRSPDSVAANVRPRWFSLFSPRAPRGTFGYVVEDDRLGGRLVGPGARLQPSRGHTAWVFRSGSWDLAFRFSGLHSQEGMDFSLELDLTVMLESRPTDVRLFLRFEGLPERVRAGDLAARFGPALRETFVRRVEGLPAAEASGLDPERTREILRESGEEVLFERGLLLSAVRRVSVDCPQYQELRRRELALKLEEERVERRLRFVELWKREELEAARARQEVAALRGGARAETQAKVPASPAEELDGTTSPEADAGEVRLLVCAGKKVYELFPERDERTTIADFESGELGYLRSVRLAHPDGEESPVILAGAQEGVYLQGHLKKSEAPGVYRFPSPPQRGGGTNATLLDGGRLYATHSEVGLVSWPRYSPGSPEVVFSASEHGAGSVRAVQRSADGEICFAADDAVLAFDPLHARREFQRWEGAGAEVTSFDARWGDVVAGTADGRLLIWERRDAPPREIARLGSHAVYAVRAVVSEGDVHYVVGSRSSFVYVRDAAGKSEMTFQATRPVRWVDASSAFIIGVDQGGCRIYLWEWSGREQPTKEFTVPDKVRDLWVVRGA